MKQHKIKFLVALIFLLVLLSCEEYIFDNPVDPGVTINAPSELSILFPSDTVAILDWKDNTSYETGYEIELSEDGTNYSLVKTIDSDITSAEIYGSYNYIPYYFRIRAITEINRSEYSVTIEGGLKPEVPTLLSPLDGATHQPLSINLSWDQSNLAETYTLQVSENSSFTNTIWDANGITAVNLQISNLVYSTDYFWRVKSSNIYDNSNWSNFRSFKTRNFQCNDSISYSGKTYHTVKIGAQCWLKENLDIGKMIDGNSGSDDQADNGIFEKYCYNNNPVNCEKYGGLYQWDEAMQYDSTEGAQGICPSGWHIPTHSEFYILSHNVGGSSNKLKAVGQGVGDGVGTNTSGFSGLLAGLRNATSIDFSNDGRAYFFNSNPTNGASSMIFIDDNDNIVLDGYLGSYKHGLSIRCLKD